MVRTHETGACSESELWPLCTISLNHTKFFLLTHLYFVSQFSRGFKFDEQNDHKRNLILCLCGFALGLTLTLFLKHFHTLSVFWKRPPQFFLLMSWNLKEFVIYCTLMFLGLLEKKQTHSITDPKPYLTVHMWFLNRKLVILLTGHDDICLKSMSITLTADIDKLRSNAHFFLAFLD